MSYQWKTKNIEIDNLVAKIEEFFKRKEFNVLKEKKGDSVKILAIMTEREEKPYKVEVEVLKEKDKIILSLLSSKKVDSSIKMGLISSFFIGGTILLKGVKYKEKVETLERELIQFVQEQISQM